ncbi:leukemia inhibitory factor receptor-like isoform X2 [Mastacembelus armatus]|uniref:leukemia inhibitory factor receptor-like isoform X2 n=1 Tax=Mastacembelus armatus TaxID=205130 RepID=UPI000E456E24|nr:leukemia inhibitory factor receptor-like isoform X2 [Mastacembelus armatus]
MAKKMVIQLIWEDDPSCSAVHDILTYELSVLIADTQVHYDEVAVTPDQIGSTHFWIWTSHLALECAALSVRLSSRYKNQKSPWKQEQIAPVTSEKIQIYPEDRVFKVGSRVTFYCVLPAGQVFDKMYLTGYNTADMNITKISNQTYELNVYLNQASKNSCTDVKCHTTTSRYGACAYVDYPPDDKDLQCETQNLESIDCHWNTGRNTFLPKLSTAYWLLGSPCPHGYSGICSTKAQVDVGERNWTLTVVNKLGRLELSDRADMTKRVHMFAPEQVTTSAVNARNASLEWRWTVQQYNDLNITCQLNVSYDGTSTITEKAGVGLKLAVLNDLIPDWDYHVTLRCGTTHLWKWSDWSARVNFHTKGDVPDALDVWMQMKENQIIIIWKMLLASQSHGAITDYAVTWVETTEPEQQNRTTVAPKEHQVALNLDTTKEYVVTVIARNKNGNSSHSIVTTPCFSSGISRVNTSRITVSNGSFSLSWSASPKASGGYVVDWCPTSGRCSVEWLRVPPHETNATIFSKNFKEGLRYSLSVYACTQGAPVLLERREGYVKEERIEDGLFKTLKGKQQDSDFEISWDPISLNEQTAFIQGYVLYWSDYKNNNTVCNVSTGNPEATSLTARNLKISSYTFTVKAQTAVGECGTTLITATLNSPTDKLIKTVFISLVTVFSLLSLLTVVCYRQWACIHQKVYPPVPKPVLTDEWLASPGVHRCRPLCVDESHQSEAENMDVPELQCKSGATVNNYLSQANMPFVFAQTSKGYYNQPLKRCSQPPLTLPTAATPTQLSLSLSPFRGVFPNLSYNLLVQPGEQQSSVGPELLEGTSLERTSGGYQPQTHTEPSTLEETDYNPESPMSCVSTYILLPQSPSK